MRPSDWCPMPRHRRSLVLPFLATVTALVGAACSSTTKTTAIGAATATSTPAATPTSITVQAGGNDQPQHVGRRAPIHANHGQGECWHAGTLVVGRRR